MEAAAEQRAKNERSRTLQERKPKPHAQQAAHEEDPRLAGFRAAFGSGWPTDPEPHTETPVTSPPSVSSAPTVQVSLRASGRSSQGSARTSAQLSYFDDICLAVGPDVYECVHVGTNKVAQLRCTVCNKGPMSESNMELRLREPAPHHKHCD